jgi:hypothetical protein
MPILTKQDRAQAVLDTMTPDHLGHYVVYSPKGVAYRLRATRKGLMIEPLEHPFREPVIDSLKTVEGGG